MKIIKNKKQLTSALKKHKDAHQAVGFVPTMGALHQGHISLIKKATESTDVVVVSIFVNPTQFNNPSDLNQYPQNLQADLTKLKQHFKDLIVFTPTASVLYGESLEAEHFDFKGLATKMEGQSRAGHFDGVATVLKKFFNIVRPDKAFFGEKDYQQLLIVKALVKLLELPIKIEACPINREANGLARSSRNERLTPKERDRAGLLYQSLLMAKKNFKTESFSYIINAVKKNFEESEELSLDYFEISDAENLESAQKRNGHKKYRAFIAAEIANVRLIDNMALN